MFPFQQLDRPTMPLLLSQLASTLADGPAVIAPEGRASFSQLAQRVANLASSLGELGVGPGDRVGVLLPNGMRWLVATFAAQAVGASVVPVNTWYRAHELDHVVARSRMRLLVGDRVIFGYDFEAALAGIGRLEAANGFGGTVFWPAEQPHPEGLEPTAVDDVGRFLDRSPAQADSEAMLLFTSGSTAEPKAVPLRHGCLLANGFQIGERQHVVVGDRLWLGSPLFFSYGCANAVPVAYTHGAALCLQERFDADQALGLIERERCTVYYGLAPVTRALIAAGSFPSADVSSLRTGTTGMTGEDKRLAIEVLGIREICSVYGLTEGYGHSAMTDAIDPLPVKLETQGTVLATQELRIAGPDGTELPNGEVGEIQLRGCVIDGYYDADQLNADSFTADRWFRTGDLGFVDDAQRLHFAGRSNEMMKVNGINVSPAEVEEVIAQHPDVDQVFVFGLSDETAGQLIGCVVVRRDNDLRAAGFADELKAWTKQRTASYKVPHRVELMRNADLPLTATGKVSKRLLQEEYEG